MLLVVEKGIRGGICHSINRYAKADNKCVKNYDKNKESSNLKYWDVNNLYGWAMSQELLVNHFKWVEDISEFDERFTKVIMEKVMKDIFLKFIFSTLKIYIKPKTICHFLPEKRKIGKVEKLVANLHEKK